MNAKFTQTIQRFSGETITQEMLEDGARLFSAHYGVWGPHAAIHHRPYAKPGKRIRMTADHLRAQLLPPHALAGCHYVRMLLDGRLVANVFACEWMHDRRKVCWVTQLVVDVDLRSRGIAKQLLMALRTPQFQAYGILSSHAHAIMAASGAFGQTTAGINLDFIRDQAPGFMAASPIQYVRDAKLHGSLWDSGVNDSSVSSADTKFWVDHEEPLRAIQMVKDAGVDWPFGELPDGHEFLLFIEPRSLDSGLKTC